MKTRIEFDAFGEIAVPLEHLWGAQTQRSLAMFHISHECMPKEFIIALAWIKRAAAVANRDLQLLRRDKADAIIAATEEIIAGKHHAEFPLVVWQTGSGTQTNMNINEVVANRSMQLLSENKSENNKVKIPVHSNDDVNLGQSSNDAIPSAIHVAVAHALATTLIPTVATLHDSLTQQAHNFNDCIKLGRTHLQDAVPITLGQEFSGYAAQVNYSLQVLNTCLPPLYGLAMGGTAVGTGLNTHVEFGDRVAAELSQSLKMPFRRTANLFAALAGHDVIVHTHAALKGLAVTMVKIANDLRWLASGPHAGLGEINLPAHEPGSSIMAGKVNPTQCEALIMCCYQVMGNDVAISLAGCSGNFELNVCQPIIIHNVCQSVRLLNDALSSFDHHCVRGVQANRQHMRELVDRSLMLATALVPHIGYQRTAQITHQAQQHKISLRNAAVDSGYVTAEQYDQWVLVEDMLGPRAP
jgi:fumarate hydratase, class II